MLTAAVAAAAVVAGITGAWSPCGFSMVETLAPSGYAGRRRTTLAACATFTLGALAGGAATFGGLAALGAATGVAAPAAAALVALAAAAGEARGTRIVPQVRRQVPEAWRRSLPVPLAAGLYGVLLGLGFTTFILSFAVWALAGIAVALGDPGLGLAAGLGFGAGRALPVIVLAPSGGGALHAAMAERPRILRSLRALDAVALAGCAAALLAAPAQAATVTVAAPGFADPSTDGAALVLHRPGGLGELRSPAGLQGLPGAHPAAGGGRLAWIVAGATVVVSDVASYGALGADAVAVSAGWVAWRNGETLSAAALPQGVPQQVATGPVGRPALSGSLLLYDLNDRIESLDLATGRRETLRRQAHAQLRGPSALGDRLVYVKATYERQQVLSGPLLPQRPASDRTVYGTYPTGRRDAGEEGGRHRHAEGHRPDLWERPPAGVADTLTTTAVAADAVYVTRVRQRRASAATAAVLRIVG